MKSRLKNSIRLPRSSFNLKNNNNNEKEENIENLTTSNQDQKTNIEYPLSTTTTTRLSSRCGIQTDVYLNESVALLNSITTTSGISTTMNSSSILDDIIHDDAKETSLKINIVENDFNKNEYYLTKNLIDLEIPTSKNDR